MNPEQWVEAVEGVMEAHRNAKNAPDIIRYFRNQFGSFGLKNEDRRKLTKQFIVATKQFSQKELVETIELLWSRCEREFQHTGMELIDHHRKKFDRSIKKVLQYMISHKSWWDTVDFIASHTVGHAFKTNQLRQEDLYEWNESDDLWLIRTSILAQLKYKSYTDWALLQELIIPHLDHKDFFIRKAIGWALREYSKTEPNLVLDFVENHTMSGLSQREALKIVKAGKVK
ncbi:MAG TPA: DNA alkylation repair protein [Saprospiraceae bacterium]|nr:DNA alkylation repair protein [Saprospiraceae bacterium]